MGVPWQPRTGSLPAVAGQPATSPPTKDPAVASMPRPAHPAENAICFTAALKGIKCPPREMQNLSAENYRTSRREIKDLNRHAFHVHDSGALILMRCRVCDKSTSKFSAGFLNRKTLNSSGNAKALKQPLDNFEKEEQNKTLTRLGFRTSYKAQDGVLLVPRQVRRAMGQNSEPRKKPSHLQPMESHSTGREEPFHRRRRDKWISTGEK